MLSKPYMLSADGNKGEQMALYTNSTQARTTKQYIWGEVAPTAGSTAPTHEDTEGKGGYRCVATTSQRDAIGSALREKGMGVFVQSNETEYILADDLNTWLIAPTQTTHNNMYVYSRWGQDAYYEQYEQYKWYDGRLDTFIISNKKPTTQDDGPILDIGFHPTIVWKTRYIDTPTVEHSGYDSEGGPCWSVVYQLSNSSIRTAAVSDGWGQAYAYTIATGRWK